MKTGVGNSMNDHIYINRRNFEVLYQPQRPKNGLLPFNHPELAFCEKTKYKIFQEDVGNLSDYFRIKCVLLIEDGNSICMRNLPGYILGFMSDYMEVCGFSVYDIYRSILRTNVITLTKQVLTFPKNPMELLRYSVTELEDIIMHYCKGVDSNIYPKPFSMYYQYYLLNEFEKYDTLQDLIIYTLLPVKSIEIYPRLLLPKKCIEGDSICKYNIPVEENINRDMILNIFQTEEIFGKLRIY